MITRLVGGLLVTLMLVGCHSSEVPPFFGVKLTHIKLTEAQVKQKEGVGEIDVSHIFPRCTRYATQITSLTDESQAWYFTKDSHQLVSVDVMVKASRQEIAEQLQKIRDTYGKETLQDDIGHEWNAKSNVKLKAAGVWAIEIRAYRSYNRVSYGIAFDDLDAVCSR